jgi:hypothetical protein
VIASKRFDSLHTDFNVATETFASIKDATKTTINSADEFAKEALSPLKDLVSQIKGLNQTASSAAMDSVKAATRFTDDMFGTFTDVAKIPEATLNSLLNDILPSGPGASATNKKLADTIRICRGNAGRGLGLSSKVKLPNCDGLSFGVNNCSKTDTAGLLNSLLNSDLAKAVKAIESLLRKIVSLASMGFAAGLCGVFAAVVNGVSNKSVLTQAAGILLNAEGKSGNTQAVLDISKSLSGINVVPSYANTTANIAENLTAPTSMAKNGVGVFTDKIHAAMEEVDKTYLGTQNNSTAALGKKNPVMSKTMGWLGSDDQIDLNNLSSTASSAKTAVAATYQSSKDKFRSNNASFLQSA